jgi:AraC-like DNA-binding protein
MESLPLSLPPAQKSKCDFYEALRPDPFISSLFDSVPGAYFFVKDRESRFMDGSRSFARTLGADSMEALIGKTDYDISPDFLADAFYADDQKVMASAEPIYNRIELVPAGDGSLDWLCTSKIPLFGHDGAVVGLAGVARMIRDSDELYADHPEMHRIVDYVREHYRRKISVSDMAAVAGISVSSQERLFKKTFGLTPLMYLRKTRLNAACKSLRETDKNLSHIAEECGFNDQTNMTRAFRLELKITPLRYRRRFSEDRVRRSGSRPAEILFPSF